MTDLTPNITDTALVFEGGGMRGAYTAATVEVLLREGLLFDHVSGISAGASHVVNYVTQDPARSRRSFVDVVDDPNFGSWRTWVRGKGVFNAEYLYEETGLEDGLLPVDMATWLANPARTAIGAFHCKSGETVYFSKDQMATLAELGRRTRASATMPGLMPVITIDGEDYVDGAVGATGGIAIDAARAAGHDRFFVVLTRPQGYRKSAPRLPKAYEAIFRRYPKVAAGLLARHEHYNRTLDELSRLEEEGEAYVFRPWHMVIGNQERRRPMLEATYALGTYQAEREAAAWHAFLGV